MGVIVKFIIKSIKEKKFRAFLIIFSIMMSTALIFSSVALSETIKKMYLERMKNSYGDTNIVVQASSKSPSRFFNSDKAEAYSGETEYLIKSVQGNGFYYPAEQKIDMFNLLGFESNDLKTMNPVVLESGSQQDFEGNKIIISKRAAAKYNLSVGSSIELEVNKVNHKFSICGIANPVGFFADEVFALCGIVPKNTMDTIFNTRGNVSNLYIKLKDPTKESYLIKEINKAYGEKYEAKEPFTQEDVNASANEIATPLMIMVVIIFFMSIFIVYTAFKVIAVERIPIVGTFRSIGATKKMTNRILMLESIFYGVIGGALGAILGVGILYIMAFITTPDWMKDKVGIQVNPVYLIVSFLIAILLSIISSAIPLRKISKIPIKDIVLNKIDKPQKNKRSKLVVALILTAIIILGPIFAPKKIAVIVDILCMGLSVAVMISFIPYLTNFFVKIFENIYVLLFGNIGILAAKNLRDNKSILNNISLLAIGIASLFMINTVSYSVNKELVSYFSNEKYANQIMLSTEGADEEFAKSLQKVDGIEGVFGIMEAKKLKVANTDVAIYDIEGAHKDKFFNYSNVDLPGDGKKLLEELGQGRNVILTTVLKDRLNVEKGDFITFETKMGEKQYKVIGFFNSIRESGSYAILPEEYLKLDMDEKYYTAIRIKTTKMVEEVKQAIFRSFPDKYLYIENMEDFAKSFTDVTDQLFTILNGFSVMAIIIGVFGILNNYIISFIERKRHLAVLKSIGMNKKQSVKMIFIEAMTGGIIGGIIGVLGGMVMVTITGFLMEAMNTSTPLHYSAEIFLLCAISGVIITVIASVAPMLKASKLNIIESIKYE